MKEQDNREPSKENRDNDKGTSSSNPHHEGSVVDIGWLLSDDVFISEEIGWRVDQLISLCHTLPVWTLKYQSLPEDEDDRVRKWVQSLTAEQLAEEIQKKRSDILSALESQELPGIAMG